MTLDALLQRVGVQDRDAFDELYRLTSTRLIGLARRVIRDESQADEVAQEAYFEIWETAHRFDRGRGCAISWMLTMTRRRAIDRVRSSQASRERDHRVAMRDQEDPVDSVARDGEVIMESERVQRAMAKLTPVQRRAIELAYLGGCDAREVAGITGVGLTTAKTRIRDGLIRLRRELAG